MEEPVIVHGFTLVPEISAKVREATAPIASVQQVRQEVRLLINQSIY